MYYDGVCLKELRKIAKILSQYIVSLWVDLLVKNTYK
jgi:hypothetical protein